MKTILLTFKRFIQDVSVGDINAVYFSTSAGIGPPNKNKERKVTWQGHLLIRYGNTMIRLHAHDVDFDLVQLEEKLTGLKEGIDAFLTEQAARLKTKAKDILIRREWLNHERHCTPHTGYYFYRIDEIGSGSFSLADCHRTLFFYLDVYNYEKKKERGNYPYHRNTKQCLHDISQALADCVAKIHELRSQVKDQLKEFQTYIT